MSQGYIKHRPKHFTTRAGREVTPSVAHRRLLATFAWLCVALIVFVIVSAALLAGQL